MASCRSASRNWPATYSSASARPNCASLSRGCAANSTLRWWRVDYATYCRRAMSDDTVTVPLQDLRQTVHAALLRAGCDHENAEALAGVMAAADGDGCASHGVFRLPGYLASLKS